MGSVRQTRSAPSGTSRHVAPGFFVPTHSCVCEQGEARRVPYEGIGDSQISVERRPGATRRIPRNGQALHATLEESHPAEKTLHRLLVPEAHVNWRNTPGVLVQT